MLSSEQDAFFKDNMYENFGDIGMNIKKMVDDFQQIAKSNQNIQTVGLYLGNLSTLVNDNLHEFVNLWPTSFKNSLFFTFFQRTWLNLLTITLNIEKCMAMFLST